MASFLKGIAAVVTINACLGNTASWLHYKDISIPPVGFNFKRMKIYKSRVADVKNVLNNPLNEPDRQSLIPLEKAKSHFLFIASKDDKIWNSEFFAIEATKLLQAHGKKPEIICYSGAGHYIEPPFFPWLILSHSPHLCQLPCGGTHYLPGCSSPASGDGPFPGIIDLYGTGGGLPEYRACLLANHGFATLALAYYNYEDLPKEMTEFHLEYFEEAVNYMLEHPQVKGPGVGLLGISKGGELCVSMASFLKGITATVVINGAVANVGAVLRYKDITIPPLGFDRKRLKIDKSGLVDIVDTLNNPLEGPNQQSLIPLEKADSCFLFIVGKDDRNWKSEFFAIEGAKRLLAHGKEKPEIICYEGAGHYIEPPYFPMCEASMHLLVGSTVVWGGEPKAHSEAQVDAWQKIQAFFHKYLSSNQSEPSKL
ncbi:acyl-coenzyme A thioesterase 1 [Alligator sinensis]|uniref:Acyl-coenzyme A thioesterase 1 n=1 Tax=Alligator sinensis TaxID=38654 RepID=A0A3Q0HGT5_ALLSI|nr:acyl-coenzyme A thioesterase 1 [Alligator sinensis]